MKSQDADGSLCNACVAFATIAVIESRLVKLGSATPTSIDLSEADLFRGGGGSCDNGWEVTTALQFCQSNGVIDETDFPYQLPFLPWPPANRRAKVTLDSFSRIDDVEQRKQALFERGPLIGEMVLNDEFKTYQGGVYRTINSNSVGDHVIAVVGYDDASDCWICKNSWGTAWGDEGYFQIAYGECGIDDVFPFYDMVLANEPVSTSSGRAALQTLINAAALDLGLRNCLSEQVCGVDLGDCDGTRADEIQLAQSITDGDSALKTWFCNNLP